MNPDANLSCWKCGGEFAYVGGTDADRFECVECGHELAQADDLEAVADRNGSLVEKLAFLLTDGGEQ